MSYTIPFPDAGTPGQPFSDGLVHLHGLLAGDERLRTVLDAMPDLVMIVDQSRRIVMCNRAVAEFSALRDGSTVVGKRPGDVLTCQNVIEPPAVCGSTEACETCGSVTAIHSALAGEQDTRECRILRGGGQGVEALDLRVCGTPFSWRGETLALVVVTDISDEKRRRLLERIFFHDLLNTAGVISGLSDLMMQGIMTPDDVKGSLHEAAQVLVTEIRNQRELLAAERNELTVSPTPVHPQIFLEKVIMAYRGLSRDRSCTIRRCPDIADLIFCSDERLLERVVGNLVKNAVEASGAGDLVTIGCEHEGAEIRFWCHNAGEIPRDVQLQLFHRSFSTKDPGRGIGTYSVKLLTERYLKGRVSFSSTRQDGTTFSVTLPLDVRD